MNNLIDTGYIDTKTVATIAKEIATNAKTYDVSPE
jgi:hypothetical protein